MGEFVCQCCEFDTNIKCHFKRHLLSKKHAENAKLRPELIPKINFSLETKKINKNPDNKKKRKKPPKRANCQYCQREFSSAYAVRRHEQNHCAKNVNGRKFNRDQMNEQLKIQKEIQEIMKSLENLKNGKKASKRIQQKYLNENRTRRFLYDSDDSDDDGVSSYLNEVHSHSSRPSNNHQSRNHVNRSNYTFTSHNGVPVHEETNNAPGADSNWKDEFMKGMQTISEAFNTQNTMNMPNTTTTHETKITINGIEIDEDPFSNPFLIGLVKTAFRQPFFKHNLQYIPVSFFRNERFLIFFNESHNLRIIRPEEDDMFVKMENEDAKKYYSAHHKPRQPHEFLETDEEHLAYMNSITTPYVKPKNRNAMSAITGSLINFNDSDSDSDESLKTRRRRIRNERRATRIINESKTNELLAQQAEESEQIGNGINMNNNVTIEELSDSDSYLHNNVNLIENHSENDQEDNWTSDIDDDICEKNDDKSNDGCDETENEQDEIDHENDDEYDSDSSIETID